MPRPGVDIVIVDGAPAGGLPLDTGQAFMVGATSKSTTDVAKVRSLREYEDLFGARSGAALMYDSVSAFFTERGSVAYISRLDTDVAAALDRFEYGFGPGQVLVPGDTNPATHEAVLAHCDKTRRCALLDAPDDDDPVVLTAAVEGLYAKTGCRFGSLWAPSATYRGASNSVVTVPWSPVQAALIALSDARTGNPNLAAAGTNGLARQALSLTQAFTDTDRETLNEAGVSLAKPLYGDIRAYGARTTAGPDDTNWLWFPNSRVVMAIAFECDAATENYVFKQIDGKGHLFAALEADLAGVCLNYYNLGALYGETAEDAFQVDTGSAVNTIDTIRNGEIHAVVRLKTSPTAEWVQIEIVKVPVDVTLAAAA